MNYLGLCEKSSALKLNEEVVSEFSQVTTDLDAKIAQKAQEINDQRHERKRLAAAFATSAVELRALDDIDDGIALLSLDLQKLLAGCEKLEQDKIHTIELIKKTFDFRTMYYKF